MSRVLNPVVIFSTGAFLLLITVLFGWVLAPGFIRDQITDQMKLQNGTEIFQNWVHTPVPIYFKVYLFNVTNPDEVASGSLPKLTESGPYVFRELREKIQIQEKVDQGIIRYKERITYFFDQERSGSLTEEDELTILNVPYVAMAQKVSELSFPLNTVGITYIVKFKQSPFIQKRVKEILFQGWEVPMVAELSEFLGQELMPNNTFGLFYGKNGTDDGFLEVDAGISSVEDFGKILSWRDKQELSWWRADSICNQIRGTDGSIFPPFVTKQRIIRIFNAELCGSLWLTFQKEVNFLGIPAYRFTAPREMLESPKTSAENRCYCNEEDDEETDKCLLDGALDLSSCRDGAPVAMSTPYFLDGFEGYQNKSGLAPDTEKHATVLDIEPTTGIVLHAHKRIQINVQLKSVADIRSLRKMPQMLFPVVWADETAEIDEDLAQQLKSQLLTPLITLEITKWALLGISLLLVFSGGLRWLSRPQAEAVDEECTDKMLNGDGSRIVTFNGKNGVSVLQRDNKNSVPFIT